MSNKYFVYIYIYIYKIKIKNYVIDVEVVRLYLYSIFKRILVSLPKFMILIRLIHVIYKSRGLFDFLFRDITVKVLKHVNFLNKVDQISDTWRYMSILSHIHLTNYQKLFDTCYLI